MNASATGTIAAISAMMGKKMDAMQKKMTSSLGDKISQCIKRELDRRKLKRSRTRSSDVEEEDDKDDEDDEDNEDDDADAAAAADNDDDGSTTVTVVAQDNQDIATWPESPTWAMSVKLNPNPQTIADVVREWKTGFNHGPSILGLKKKYKSKWCKKKAAMGQNISRMKIIMEALKTQGGNEDEAIVRMQNELYNFFEATTEEEKNQCHVKKCIWSGKKNYVDDMLRPCRVGYTARQTALVERAGKRQKVADN